MLKKAAFTLARHTASAWLVGTAFTHFSRLLPVRRVYEDQQALVFFHPRPGWPFHALAVPKLRRASLAGLDLDDPQEAGVILHLLWALQQTAARHKLGRYRVLVNGGRYQDVPQLHLHLLAGAAANGVEHLPAGYEAGVEEAGQAGAVYAYPARHPVRQVHEIVTVGEALPGLAQLDFQEAQHTRALLAIVGLAQRRVIELGLGGYALVWLGEPASQAVEAARLHAHLISGGVVVSCESERRVA